MADNHFSYFSVQRSTDGENFTEIARLKQSHSNNAYRYLR